MFSRDNIQMHLKRSCDKLPIAPVSLLIGIDLPLPSHSTCDAGLFQSIDLPASFFTIVINRLGLYRPSRNSCHTVGYRLHFRGAIYGRDVGILLFTHVSGTVRLFHVQSCRYLMIPHVSALHRPP
jgi:hypothetical protein